MLIFRAMANYYLFLLHIATLPMPPTPSPHIHAAPRHAAAKEHVENFLRRHVALEAKDFRFGAK